MTDAERTLRLLLADRLHQKGIPRVPGIQGAKVDDLAHERPVPLSPTEWYILMAEGYLDGVEYSALAPLIEPEAHVP